MPIAVEIFSSWDADAETLVHELERAQGESEWRLLLKIVAGWWSLLFEDTVRVMGTFAARINILEHCIIFRNIQSLINSNRLYKIKYY